MTTNQTWEAWLASVRTRDYINMRVSSRLCSVRHINRDCLGIIWGNPEEKWTLMQVTWELQTSEAFFFKFFVAPLLMILAQIKWRNGCGTFPILGLHLTTGSEKANIHFYVNYYYYLHCKGVDGSSVLYVKTPKIQTNFFLQASTLAVRGQFLPNQWLQRGNVLCFFCFLTINQDFRWSFSTNINRVVFFSAEKLRWVNSTACKTQIVLLISLFSVVQICHSQRWRRPFNSRDREHHDSIKWH